MHANRLMPNVYRKKLLAFTIICIQPPSRTDENFFQTGMLSTASQMSVQKVQ